MTQLTFGFNELNQGFVVAIQLEANPGEEERLATSLQELIGPTMAEPGVKLFLPYRSQTDTKLFFVYELYVNVRRQFGRSPKSPGESVGHWLPLRMGNTETVSACSECR